MIPCDPEKWRLFIDSPKTSLKVVLLANGNELPSVPVAYCVNMRETYRNISRILEKINYHDYNWKVCSDLKVVALITRLQSGFTKYCCFLWEWGSRAREKHYIIRNWPHQEGFTPGYKNVAQDPPLLLIRNKIFTCPIAHQTRTGETVYESYRQDRWCISILKIQFPRLCEAKIK